MCTVMSSQGQQSKNPLTKSLEKLLEDAHLSGELVLSGRKLRDFPKLGIKFTLHDLVVADLSKNKFNEVPEEVTKLIFLEKLDFSNNVIRSIPESINGLKSLTLLDLSRNHLSSLPREICQLPIQIFLISHNRLTSLPDELCRMTTLSELDASNNQITHLPPHLSNLEQLRSLILRNNQLLCLPVELTYLKLIRLDLQGNKIATLPLELRHAKTLQLFCLDDNPLTSPAMTLCRRGRVHIFKYLEQEAVKMGIEVVGKRSRRVTTAISSVPTSTLDLQKSLLTNGDSCSSSDSADCCLNGNTVQTYGQYKEAIKQQRAQDYSHTYRNSVNKVLSPEMPTTVLRAQSKSDQNLMLNSSLGNNIPNVPEICKPINNVNNCDMFALRREMEKAKEESELISRLRHIIESRLKTDLPEDLAPALSDGVILCHLVNQIKPQSVASIHIPSSTVPKLTMARCRRNVDNFLEACRKLGLNEGQILTTTDDIVFAFLNNDEEALNRLLKTIENLTLIIPKMTPIKNGFLKLQKMFVPPPPPLLPTTLLEDENRLVVRNRRVPAALNLAIMCNDKKSDLNNNSTLDTYSNSNRFFLTLLLVSIFCTVLALLLIFPPPE